MPAARSRKNTGRSAPTTGCTVMLLMMPAGGPQTVLATQL